MGKYLPIGLDIGASAIKMVQLQEGRGGLAVAACAQAARDGRGDDAVLVADIKALLRKGKFHGRECVSCLLPEEVFIRNIRLPRTSAERAGDLSAAVAKEAQEKFGFDPAAATIRFVPAGEVREGNDVFDEVILFAAHQGNIESHLGRLEAIGLDAVSLDVEPCALFRVFDSAARQNGDQNEARVVADIGASTKVLIAQGSDILLAKRIPIGGKRFDLAVAEELGLSTSEAEVLRRESSGNWKQSAEEFQQTDDPDVPAECEENYLQDAVLPAILPHLEALAGEISLCLRYHSVTFRGGRPQEITLVGGETKSSIIVQMLGKRLDMDISVPNEFDGIATEELKTAAGGNGLGQWAVAVGLSMKAMFIPPPLQFGMIRQLALSGGEAK